MCGGNGLRAVKQMSKSCEREIFGYGAAMRTLSLLSILMPLQALAQGGHFLEGAQFSLINAVLMLAVILGVLIAIGLIIARPADPAPSLTGPTLGGLALAVVFVVGAAIVMVWTESVIVGAIVALGLGAGYVGLIARWWRRQRVRNSTPNA
jgi:hypothetical protein